jgi:magnesium transporter
LAPESVAKELRGLLRYDPDTAGHLMDPRIAPPRVDATVDEALAKLRALRQRARREIFAIDEEGRLAGRVEIQDLALADPAQPLRDLIRPVVAAVNDLAPREEIVEKLEGARLSDLPVVDIDGRLIGVLADSAVLSAIQEEATIDIQKMFGASGDERSLSSPLFAVRKRLPWLQVNLLTAFAAAAVIAMFQGLINVYPTLAVLMGVVAGQSGNAGAQSLAVTMRGLALREIGIRHWPRVVFKESSAGFMNGLAVAATTSIAVFLIYRSAGLAIIIASAMIIAMVAAGFSGALIPITMRRFGLDPAQSSSIVLTTVTDVTSFLSFLGIASILAPMI